MAVRVYLALVRTLHGDKPGINRVLGVGITTIRARVGVVPAPTNTILATFCDPHEPDRSPAGYLGRFVVPAHKEGMSSCARISTRFSCVDDRDVVEVRQPRPSDANARELARGGARQRITGMGARQIVPVQRGAGPADGEDACRDVEVLVA